MKIHVYGKPGCGKCESAKAKLLRMKLEYTEHNLGYHIEHHEGWREDGSVEAMAAHTLLDTLPIFKINGEHYDYSGGMKKIKQLRREK